MSAPSRRARNDPAQYDDLVDQWWRPDGELAALHWLAEARAALVPPPERPGALLVDVACGGGLLAPHLRGYRHVGVDLSPTAVAVARAHGVEAVQGDVTALPLGDGCADVVVAGEILEHVPDLAAAVAECARVLRPEGLFVADTIAATLVARVGLVTLAEHLPGGPPRGCHDPGLFVAPARLRSLGAANSIDLRFRGLRPSVPDYLRFLVRRHRPVRMRPTRSLATVYQAWGRKA